MGFLCPQRRGIAATRGIPRLLDALSLGSFDSLPMERRCGESGDLPVQLDGRDHTAAVAERSVLALQIFDRGARTVDDDQRVVT